MDRANAWPRRGWFFAPFVALALLVAACGGGGTAPTVTTTNPADGATDVSVTANVSVTFSQAMNQAGTEAAFSSVPAITCAFSWNPAGTAMTCAPASELAANTAYAVTIAATAETAVGTPLGSPFAFGFTTGGTVDDTCVFGTSLFGSCRFGP
jgi:hypothetical protein